MVCRQFGYPTISLCVGLGNLLVFLKQNGVALRRNGRQNAGMLGLNRFNSRGPFRQTTIPISCNVSNALVALGDGRVQIGRAHV
jgi:hypothetical protein